MLGAPYGVGLGRLSSMIDLVQLYCGRLHVWGSSTHINIWETVHPGNERADELVQWRKGKGPTKQQYKRLDIDGGLMIRELCEVL